MDQDELQIIDTLVKAKEEKDKQSNVVTSIEVWTDDLTMKESSVIVSLSVHNDLDGEPQVKLSFQVVEQGPLQAS